MTANVSPIHVLTPQTTLAIINGINTALDGTGSNIVGPVATGGINGSRLFKIIIQATDATIAGLIRMFYNFGSGSNLIAEYEVTAHTPSDTDPAFSLTINFPEGLIIAPGHFLQFTATVNYPFNVFAFAGDY